MRRLLAHFLFPLILTVVGIGPTGYSQTTKITPVGPGVWHREIYNPSGPWAIHVTEVELTNPYIRVETVKADDHLQGNERTSQMAARRSYTGHLVVGAVNSDFYSTGGIPVGTQVIQGEILKDPVNRSVFGLTSDHRPFIDIVNLLGILWTPERRSLRINGINRTREANEAIVHNRYLGGRTGTNVWGAELTLRALQDFAVGDTVRLVATALDSLYGNQPIPPDGLVISGHGSSRRFLLDNCAVGDTLSVYLRLSPIYKRVEEAVGGVPRILRDGQASVEYEREGGSNIVFSRHPRTAVGFSQDSTRLFLVTVDGRQPGYSEGMSLFELADFMLGLGAYQAMNLDGGGSTTMVVRDRVVNRPSDAAGERAVANALLVVSSAPIDTLATLQISPQRIQIFSSRQFQFAASGFDRFWNPLDISTEPLIWNCDSRIGSITPTGLFTAATQWDSGYVWVAKGRISDSAWVVVDVLKEIELLPNPVVLDPGEGQQMTPKARDTGGNAAAFELSDFRWRVIGNVGNVNATGYFVATDSGQGWIEARMGTVVGRAQVFVGAPAEGLLDGFEEPLDWSLNGMGVHLNECTLTLSDTLFLSPPMALRLRYSFTKSGGTAVLFLERGLPISGSPGELSVQVFGDGRGHHLEGEFADRQGELFRLNFAAATPTIDWEGEWRQMSALLTSAQPDWGNPHATVDFPILWKRFKLFLGGGILNTKVTVVLYFDDFKARYLPTGVASPPTSAGESLGFALLRNYPNPFNPTTTIGYQVSEKRPVTITVYNLLGEQVTTLVDEIKFPGHYETLFDGSDCAAGVYFYRLKAGDFQQWRKMVLLN